MTVLRVVQTELFQLVPEIGFSFEGKSQTFVQIKAASLAKCVYFTEYFFKV